MTRMRVCLPLIVLLVSCSAAPTPFPAVVTVQPSPVATESAPSLRRYGISPELWGLVSIPDQSQVDLVRLPTNSESLQLNEAYRVIVSVEQIPGGQPLPFALKVGLLINPYSESLADEAVRNLLGQALAGLVVSEAQMSERLSSSAVRVKSDLANLGWPDGIDLKLAGPDSPVTERVADRLRQAGFPPLINRLEVTDSSLDLQLLAADLLLIFWLSDDQRSAWMKRVEPDEFLPIAELPIWYRTEDGSASRFTESGWPLPD